MSSFLMRFTPRKTGVVLHGEPTFATSSASSEQQHHEPTKKEDEQQMLETQNSSSSVSVSSTTKKQEQEQAAVAAASSSKHKQYYRGMEIISLPSCSIPEPTISIAGHAFLVLVWWSAFIIFGALTVFVFFFDHQNSQSVALPTMLSQDPVVPVRFAITCVETSNSWTEGELIQSNRTITSKLHMKYSSTSSCASKSTVLTQQMTKDKTSSTTNNSSTFTFSSNSLVGSLCFEKDQPFSALPANPDIFGMYLELTSDKIDGVTSTPLCYVDFESSMVPPEQEKNSGIAAAASSNSTTTTNFYRLRRMNVETLAVRVLTVGHYTKYFTTDRHKDVVELRDQYIYPQVYDLEGQRGSWGLENENIGAILVVKFLNTAIVVTENDPRTFFNFVGWFGSWWRSTDLFLFWIFPVVCTFFARNFLEDSQTGKVDGYTKDLLADAWKPLFSLWIAEVLMRSIGQLMKGGKA